MNYPNGQRVEYEYDVLGNRLSRTVTQDTYLITAVVTPETAGTVEGAGNYAPGTEATLAATANEGYSFANWTENGETVSMAATYTFTVNGARNLVANFTQATYVVTATAAPENGGTITGAGTYVHGDTVTLAANAYAGYSFINWTENGEVVSAESIYSFVVNAAHTLVAHFGINSYAVSVEATPEEGGTVTGAGTYDYGTTATLTATANPGYTFYNWTMNGQQVSTNATYTFTVTEQATYVAHFSLNNYLITAIASPTEGGTVSGGGNYAHGSIVVLNAVPNDNYEFVNWTKNGQQVSDSVTYSFPVQESGTYIAHFTLKSYTVTAMANPEAGGMVTGVGEYVFGTMATLVATANEGYSFLNWTQDGEEVSTDPTYSFEVTGAAAFVANFELNSYEITATANPEAGGTVEGAGTYDHGATATLIATANEGYSFTNWTKNGTVVSTEASYSFTVTEQATYVAHFSLNNYLITAIASPTEGGTVSGGGNYAHGSIVVLNAVPNDNYEFVNWTKNGQQVSDSVTYSFPVQESGTYIAHFTLKSYTVTAMANPEAGGTVTGSGDYVFGTSATLVATANEGYFFLNWTQDGEEVSTEPTYSFTVTGNASYVANFVESFVTQTTNFAQGWNWWSTFINVDGYNSLGMLEEALGTNAMQIKSQSDFAQYLEIPGYGGYWYGTLDTILSNKQTYMIQASSACQVEIIGAPVSPADHPITILPGWNWIGFPSSSAISFAEAFAGFTPTDGDQVKSQSGFSQYMFVLGYGGVWYGGLETGNLTPGMGLMYKSMSTGNATLVYPNAGRSVENVSYIEKHWNNDIHAYSGNMTLMAVVELDDAELASDNYELAVFAAGECRGSGKLTYVEPLNRHFAFLTIAGDEAAELYFGLYDHTTGEENFESNDVIVYTTDASIGSFNAPMVVRFGGTAGLNDLEPNLHVYPNPVNRGQSFSIGMDDMASQHVCVEIVNELGETVAVEALTSQPAHITAPNTAGVYMLRVFIEGKGTRMWKLVVN